MSAPKPRRLNDLWNFYNDLRRQMNLKNFKLTNVETRDFTPIYTSNENTIAAATTYKNTLQHVVANPNVKVYRLPTEPDGVNLVLWNMNRSVGADGQVLKDDSGFENHGQIFGSTSRTAGHVEGLDAITANGVTDYAKIPDDGVLNTLGGTTKMGGPVGPGTVSAMTSMSITFWHKPVDISLSGGKPRIIACKVDQCLPTQPQLQGWSCWIEPDGTVWVSFKKGNVVRAKSFTRRITQLGIYYFIAIVMTSLGGSNPTVRLFVNAVESTEPTSSTKNPYFGTVDGGLALFINGTDEGNSIGRVNGATGDFRLWWNRDLFNTELQNQYENKYTIADIDNVARAGDAYVAVEGTEGGGNPGDPPGNPPDPLVNYSYSALSHSPDSHSIDEANAATPGGMGIAGGTAGSRADPAIPAQFFDSFKPAYWALTSLNQVSPDSKWKLANLPGTGGFVRTESYTHPGEQSASNTMRIKFGTATPVVQTNAAKFGEFYARYTIRTITRSDSNEYSAGQFLFKYIDNLNFAYLVLRPSNVEIRKVVAGVETLVGTGPTRANVFQPGSIHTVEMWLREDGQFIEVVVDNDAAATKLTVGSQTPGAVAVDPVLSAVAAMAFRASNSDIMVDDLLVRPLLSDGFENGSPWSLTTVNSISPAGRWKLEVAQGTGGQCRTLTTGGGTSNNILDIRHGTASPILLSQTTFTNLLMEWEYKTDSQLVVAQNNRLHTIFKWKDSSNYYYFVAHPSGWQIRRVIAGGVDEIRVTSNANGLADAASFTTGHYKLLVTNAGKDIELSKAGTVLYREEWGIIKVAATGGSNTETVSEDDGGVLAGAGKVGFRATQCDAAVAWISVFPS